MTTQEWQNKVLIASKNKHVDGQCDISGEKFDEKNSPDGIRGFEIRVLHPDIPSKSIAIGVCKKVYLEFYKDTFPKAQTPKI